MVPHGRGSIIVWRCLTEFGPGQLVLIEGRLTGRKYTEVLAESYFETLHNYNIPWDSADLVFQQDYNPKHTFKVTTNWIDCHNIKCLPWVSWSSGISIIENAWEELDRRIQKQVPLPQNKKELWEAAQEEWANILLDYIDSLYDSLPACIN
uniref:Tc1-like transposase DDE domain-containing protein n=1 Tax=Moniliophthora roreri TaxID=221103 RepID=A0A0W0F730_MONRR